MVIFILYIHKNGDSKNQNQICQNLSSLDIDFTIDFKMYQKELCSFKSEVDFDIVFRLRIVNH